MKHSAEVRLADEPMSNPAQLVLASAAVPAEQFSPSDRLIFSGFVMTDSQE
jgi:hypothetical protein